MRTTGNRGKHGGVVFENGTGPVHRRPGQQTAPLASGSARIVLSCVFHDLGAHPEIEAQMALMTYRIHLA